MDEFWRALATVVPALLLFLQNKFSGDREKAERKDIRDADTERETAESLRAKQETEEAKTERLRASLVRFIRIADKIATERFSLDPRDDSSTLSTGDAEELTSAYADASLQVRHQRLLDAVDALRKVVEDIVVHTVAFRGPPDAGYEEAFRAAMDQLRAEARSALNVPTIVKSGDSVTLHN